MRVHKLARVSAAFLLLSASLFAQAGNTVETADHVSRKVTLQRGADVSIENDLGGIEVTGQSGSEAVIEIEKRYGGGNEATKQRLKEAKIHVDASASSLRIRVEWPNCFMDCSNWNWNGERPGVYIRLRVPSAVNVTVDHDRGSTSIANIQGNVSIESDRSPVVVEDLTGSLRVKLDRGEIKVRDLTLTGNLEIDSDRGPIDVTMTKLGGNVDISADRGNVRLAVPSDAGMDIYVNGSRRTSFQTEFPLQVTGRISGADTKGSVNGGGHKVHIEADRGKVDLVKARTAS